MNPIDPVIAEILTGLGSIQAEQKAQRAELGEVKRQVLGHSTQLSTLLDAAGKIEAVARVRQEHRARLYAFATLLIGAFGASAAGIGFIVRHTLG